MEERSRIYVLERLFEPLYRSPESRLRFLVQWFRANGGTYKVVTADNAEELLRKHTTQEDIPYGGSDLALGLNLGDVMDKLSRGVRVYQYEIEPNKKAPAKVDDGLPPPPEGWVHVDDLAEAKGVTSRTVMNNLSNFEAMKCSGSQWYVKPDAKLDYWITRLPSPETLYHRVSLATDVMEAENPQDLDELYEMVAEAEREMGVVPTGIYSSMSIAHFFEKSLVPQTIEGWRGLDQNDLAILKQQRDEVYL